MILDDSPSNLFLAPLREALETVDAGTGKFGESSTIMLFGGSSMTHQDLITVVTSSESDNWLKHEDRGVFTFKLNLDIAIREKHSQDLKRKPFKESWAMKFPDPVAFTVIYELWYRSSFVKEYYFVSVDGHRAMLPYPDTSRFSNHLRITREQFAIATAVNGLGNCERYLQRFEISDRAETG